MKNLGRYLKNHFQDFGRNSFKNILILNSLPKDNKPLSYSVVRTFAENKVSQGASDSDKYNQNQQEKKTKHIYKKKEQNLAKEENSDIIRQEKHFFREGFSNGIHIREEVSYVCYEFPSEGRTAESTGKSEDSKNVEKDKNIESSKINK